MMDKKKLTPRHIIIKRPKVKDKEGLFKAKKNKLVTRRLPDGKGVWRNGWRGEGFKKHKYVVIE